jgi:hypothetical protein
MQLIGRRTLVWELLPFYQADDFTVTRVRTPHRSRSADWRASKIRALMLSEYTEGDSWLELSELKDTSCSDAGVRIVAFASRDTKHSQV